MRYVRQLGNTLLLAALVACSSTKAPQPTASNKNIPQVLPSALLRAAYDAPQWNEHSNAPATETVAPPKATASSAPIVPTLLETEDKMPMDPHEWASAGQPGPIVGQAAPVSLEFNSSTSSSQANGGMMANVVPEVPSAPRSPARGYQSNVDFSEFDPVVITDSRSPRAQTSPASKPVRIASAQKYTPVPAPRQVAERQQTPQPTSAPSPSPSFEGKTVSVMPEQEKSAPAQKRTGAFGLHLASYKKEANAVNGWQLLRKRHPDLLAALSARGHSVTIEGKGDYVRLLVGPFSTPASAKDLCSALKALDEYCKVMPFQGVPML